jgi:hypothetical protein
MVSHPIVVTEFITLAVESSGVKLTLVPEDTKMKSVMTVLLEENKALVLQAFDVLFNKRDYSVAQRYWSPEILLPTAFSMVR